MADPVKFLQIESMFVKLGLSVRKCRTCYDFSTVLGPVLWRSCVSCFPGSSQGARERLNCKALCFNHLLYKFEPCDFSCQDKSSIPEPLCKATVLQLLVSFFILHYGATEEAGTKQDSRLQLEEVVAAGSLVTASVMDSAVRGDVVQEPPSAAFFIF